MNLERQRHWRKKHLLAIIDAGCNSRPGTPERESLNAKYYAARAALKAVELAIHERDNPSDDSGVTESGREAIAMVAERIANEKKLKKARESAARRQRHLRALRSLREQVLQKKEPAIPEDYSRRTYVKQMSDSCRGFYDPHFLHGH